MRKSIGIFFILAIHHVVAQENLNNYHYQRMLELLEQNNIGYYKEISLIDFGWEFSTAGKNEWLPAGENVNIHLNLFENKLIPHPYQGTAEKDLQWIAETDWEYRARFFTPVDTAHISCELEMEGVYTFADVYVNDHLVLQTDNAFRKWKKEVFEFLETSDTVENIIRIVFHSPVKKGKALMQNYAYPLPGDERLFVRAPQYQWGWDWAPRFVNMGLQQFPKFIFKTKNTVELNQVRIIQKKLTEKISKLEAVIEINSFSDRKIYIPDPVIWDKKTKGKYFQLKAGKNTIIYPITIKKPELWWPNGYEYPAVEEIEFNILDQRPRKKRTVHHFDYRFIPYAHCSIELINDKDSIGKGFYFKVNGVPIYAKGMNLVPGDSFDPMNNIISETGQPTVCDRAYEMNANMIRVWGGGVYPDEKFYFWCMMHGMMVWQDFMFGGGMIPGDVNYTHNVKEEIKQQVARLRNYNNIAVWCGNNEMDEGWNNWGWQKQYKMSASDSASVWNDYYKMFHETIPGILKELDPKKSYIPTSPEYGWGRKQSMTHSDSHYWGVWWGKEPLEKYNEKVPRFMSEFGMQSAPHQNVFRHFNSDFQMISDTGMYLFSPELKNHQKHPTGFETLNEYLKKYYSVPKNYDDYSFATQLLQAGAMRTAIEAQRRDMPRCMGSLVWQLNDCWPAISWSLVDYKGNKKIACHAVKKAFDDMLISVKEETDRYDFYIVSEGIKNEKDSLIIYIADFNGKKLFSEKMKINIAPLQSKIYYSIDKSKLVNIPLDKVFMYYSLSKNKYENTFHFVKPNELKLPSPEIELSFTNEKYLGKNADTPYYQYEYQLEIISDTYVPSLMIYDTEIFYPFILPGKKITRTYSVALLSTHQFNKEEAVSNLKKEIKSLPQLLQIK